MQVVAMPLVYGTLAFDSVVQLVRLITGEMYSEAKFEQAVEGTATWTRMAHLAHQRDEMNMEVADLYEAWALWCFGRLLIMRVRRKIRSEMPHLAQLTEDADPEDIKDLEVLISPEKFLFEPLEATTGMGVKVFVFTYVLKSVYVLGITIVAGGPFYLNICEEVPGVCALLPHVEGAAFIASSIAIYNLIIFEHNFADILHTEQFEPVLKFLAVKLLVTITFLQSVVMDVVLRQMLHYSVEQIRLCYTCALCFEVLPLSVLHLCGWRRRDGDWYECDKGGHMDGNPVGRLACEAEWATNYKRLAEAERGRGGTQDQNGEGMVRLRTMAKAGDHRSRHKSFLSF